MSNNQKFGERTVMSKIKERKLSEKERARLVRMREVTKVREDKGLKSLSVFPCSQIIQLHLPALTYILQFFYYFWSMVCFSQWMV